METFPFQDDCILLSGGSQGIGRAMVIEFVRRGGRVVFGDINVEGGEEVLQLLGKDAERAVFVPADFGREDAWQNLLTALPEGWNPTILVSNVGVGLSAPVESVCLADYERLMQTNLRSAFLGMQAVLPSFEKAGRGAALFVGSLMSESIFPNSSVYATTKAGLIGLTRSLAVELAPKRIRVNIVLPGFTRIDPLHNFRAKVPHELWGDFSRRYHAELSAVFERFQPLPCCIVAEDIARAAAFLCSDEARCITGVELLVDGAANLWNTVKLETVGGVFDWNHEKEEWLAGEMASRGKVAK